MNNFKSISILVCLLLISAYSNGQQNKRSLLDFYKYDADVEHQVDAIFNRLNDTTRIAQMIVTSAGELGKPENVILKLVWQTPYFF